MNYVQILHDFCKTRIQNRCRNYSLNFSGELESHALFFFKPIRFFFFFFIRSMFQSSNNSKLMFLLFLVFHLLEALNYFTD